LNNWISAAVQYVNVLLALERIPNTSPTDGINELNEINHLKLRTLLLHKLH